MLNNSYQDFMEQFFQAYYQKLAGENDALALRLPLSDKDQAITGFQKFATPLNAT